jgi:hypothetical protein
MKSDLTADAKSTWGQLHHKIRLNNTKKGETTGTVELSLPSISSQRLLRSLLEFINNIAQVKTRSMQI